MSAAAATVAQTTVTDKETLNDDARMPEANGAQGMPREKAKKGTLKRLLKYVFAYRARMVFIIIAIIVSAVAQAGSALFLQALIDRYIMPLVGERVPNWAPLIQALVFMGILYALGTFSAWLYSYLLVGVEQGVMKQIRDEMFSHMQTLPISYFDTHEHGDVMSRYTNDTDTLRQAISQSLPQMFASGVFSHMQTLPISYFDTHEHGDVMSRYTNDTDTLRQAISQSLPQMFASGVSALAALIAMLYLSIPYTVFVLVFTGLLLLLIRVIVSRSGHYPVDSLHGLRPCVHRAAPAAHPRDREPFGPLLRGAAAGARRRERVRRGVGQRAEGHQGLQPRGRHAGVVRRPQRAPVPCERKREHLRQRADAGRRQHGLSALCALRDLRRPRRTRQLGQPQLLRRRVHHRHDHLAAHAVQILRQPDRSGLAADDDGHDGTRGRVAHLRADGRAVPTATC